MIKEVKKRKIKVSNNEVVDFIQTLPFFQSFVKSFPALSTGFEIETELTVHALELRMPTAEIRNCVRARRPSSVPQSEP